MALVSRALLAFIAVAEELHFGRAARRLHMTQPPLSQQIAEFEKSVGATLLLRTTRSVQLTPAGQRMLERARQLVEDANGAVRSVQQLATGEVGNLALGFTHSTVYRVLPRALAAYRRVAPQVGITLRQHTSDVLVDLLRSGVIDVALARLSPSMMEDFETVVVARDRMVLLMPEGHPLCAHRFVPMQALDGVDFIDYEPAGARYLKDLVDTILAAGGARPKTVHLSFLPTLFALVEAGMGVALVPESAAASLKASMVSRPLALPRKDAEAVLYAAWRRASVNPAIAAFAAEMRRLVPR